MTRTRPLAPTLAVFTVALAAAPLIHAQDAPPARAKTEAQKPAAQPESPAKRAPPPRDASNETDLAPPPRRMAIGWLRILPTFYPVSASQPERHLFPHLIHTSR
jgi:hypothetical protein